MLLISHYFFPFSLLLFRCKFNVSSSSLPLCCLALPLAAPICREHDISRMVTYICTASLSSSIVDGWGLLSLLGVHSNLSLLRISEMVSWQWKRGECNGKCLEETKTIGRQSFFVTRFSFFFLLLFLFLSLCLLFLLLFLPSSPHRQQPLGLSHYQRKISIFRLIFCSFHYWNNNRVYYCWEHCRNKQKTNKQTEV